MDKLNLTVLLKCITPSSKIVQIMIETLKLTLSATLAVSHKLF